MPFTEMSTLPRVSPGCGPMSCRPVRWFVLVLLASCTASSLAVDVLLIDSMTWTYTSTLIRDPEIAALEMCTDTNLTAGDTFRLVVKTNGTEKTFNGDESTEVTNCATFSEEDKVPPPSTEESVYQLTVSNTEEVLSGSVSFAYPIKNSEIINCGGTKFGRLTLTETLPQPSNCFSSTASESVCYVDIVENGTVCMSGLDPDNEGFEVCTAGVSEIESESDPSFVATYLEYADSAASASISYTFENSGDLTELLSRANDSVLVHSCSGDKCELSPFSPSIAKYELCGVFIDDENAVTTVGTTTFQDIKLTVDSTSPTVDFHFYNVIAGKYNVYKDVDFTNPDELTIAFVLDCSLIPETSFCNGFFLPEEKPTNIAVSSEDATNAVLTEVVYQDDSQQEVVLREVPGNQ